jgi:hypothetical protein
MRRAEQIVSLFWVAFAIWVCIGSLGLKLGTFSDPGPGFLPFGAGTLLGIFAIAHLCNLTFRHPEKEDTELPWRNINWRKGVYTIIALFTYAFLLPTMGYLIDTFLLMFFFFSILGRKKWWAVLIGSLIVIGITYFVFEIWLMVQFPKGFLGTG